MLSVDTARHVPHGNWEQGNIEPKQRSKEHEKKSSDATQYNCTLRKWAVLTLHYASLDKAKTDYEGKLKRK